MTIKTKIGLFFGSFNPVHIGHTALANYIVNQTDLAQIWFVVSPHNPLKEKKTLLADHHRFEMVLRAIGDSHLFKASNIEFKLSKPSYTIDTLTYLSEKYPQHLFVPIIGADSLETFHKWKNYQQILEHYELYVYPRPAYDGGGFKQHEKVKWIDAPQIEISSSMIRQSIEKGLNVEFFMPRPAYEYLFEMNFYKK